MIIKEYKMIIKEYKGNLHEIERVFEIEGDYVTVVSGVDPTIERWVDVLLMSGSDTAYELPQGIHIQADTEVNICYGDNDYQDFSYIEIGDRTFLYEENYLGLCLDEIELVNNGPYVGFKMID